MYNESYEEYIRNILGYPNYNPTIYENSYSMTNPELEACYPEIYKVVYPMITNACARNTKPITSSLVDELTDEIYSAIETNKENRREDRQYRNSGLQNLIKILLIRELLGRPGNNFPGNRPPMPPPSRPPRPYF